MTYNDQKQQTLTDQEDDAMYECSECGKPVKKYGQYCSKKCIKASEL